MELMANEVRTPVKVKKILEGESAGRYAAGGT